MPKINDSQGSRSDESENAFNERDADRNSFMGIERADERASDRCSESGSMKGRISNKVTKSAIWASSLFYGLIAFEFFYMFSPFAAYLYSVYGPGLHFLNLSESTSWLIGFFMPHVVFDTKSWVISWHETIGALLFAGGLIAFVFGAVQIYRNKLLKRGAVATGIYRRIRHPQYLALMIAGFGMVLLWPRYLVLFGFVTICFAYYFLARLEERICLRSYPEYGAYMQNTGMFLPFDFGRLFWKMPWLQTSGRVQNAGLKLAIGFGFYLVVLASSFLFARALHIYSVKSVYAYETGKEVYLSVGRMDLLELEMLAVDTKNDPEVMAYLAQYDHPDHRFINYVMPADLLVSEVPMYIPEGQTPGHQSPHKLDQTRFKIIFTIAHFGPGQTADGRRILLRAIHKSPVVEVWINRNTGNVENILDPPATGFYDGIPVPVF